MFEQAGIKVERVEEYQQLRDALERVFEPGRIERFLKKLESKGIAVRDLESVLQKRLLERVDEALAQSGRPARELYQALAVSDQAQIREFYLMALENVNGALRHKFQKIYRYR